MINFELFQELQKDMRIYYRGITQDRGSRA